MVFLQNLFEARPGEDRSGSRMGLLEDLLEGLPNKACPVAQVWIASRLREDKQQAVVIHRSGFEGEGLPKRSLRTTGASEIESQL